MGRRLAAAATIGAVLVLQTAWMPAAAQPSPGPVPSPSAEGAECVVCHAHPQILSSTGEERPELLVRSEIIGASVHSDLTCVSCHSALTSSMHAKRDVAIDSCAGCHGDQAELLAEGDHGSPDTLPALTCVSCHGNHAIIDVDTEAFRLRMDRRCSTCHTEMGDRFFGGNPFGMETHLGRSDVATCWDCHRSHRVLPVADPDSPVNPANLLATCRRCHEGAPENFADIKIHVASSPIPDDERLRAVTLYMLMILVGTFAFFGYHTILQIRHELRKPPGPDAALGGDA